MTILAYVIVIVLSQFTLLVGVIFTMFFGLIFFWLPDCLINKVAPLLGFFFGPLASLGFSWLIFKWLAQEGSWGVGALCAALIPLYFPISNDFKKAKELEKIKSEAESVDQKHIEENTGSLMYGFYGEVFGVFCAVLVFSFLQY